MVKIARAVLCSIALLQGSDAFRSKQKRKVHYTPAETAALAQVSMETRESMKAEDTCGSRLLNVAVYAVNQALGWALDGKDPLNTTLHAGNYEVDLWGCNAGLAMDASARVAGFKGTSIQYLNCGEQEGDEVTVTGRMTFGADIDTDAQVAAQWSLCGLDLASGDSEIAMGVHSADPGLKVSVHLKKTSIPFIWRITKIKAFETDLGDLDRFTCGISNVPGFIGSRFEQWCVSIIQWLADKIQNHLMKDVDEIFMGLVNDLLDAIPI